MVSYLSIKEIAEKLKVSDPSVRRWIRIGDLKATRVGSLVRVSESDLEDFLREYEPRIETVGVAGEND